MSDVMLCRCYEVSEATVDEAIANGAKTINDVKRMTPACLGFCKGIYCGPKIAANLHPASGAPIGPSALMTARPPVRLISLGDLERTVPEP